MVIDKLTFIKYASWEEYIKRHMSKAVMTKLLDKITVVTPNRVIAQWDTINKGFVMEARCKNRLWKNFLAYKGYRGYVHNVGYGSVKREETKHDIKNNRT